MDTQPSAAGVLKECTVGDISGHFVVCPYQRGYRWGRDEVGRLLDGVVMRTHLPSAAVRFELE